MQLKKNLFSLNFTLILSLVIPSYSLLTLSIFLLICERLLRRYQRKVDVDDVEKISIQEYCDEEDRIVSDTAFQLYFEVWNKVRLR